MTNQIESKSPEMLVRELKQRQQVGGALDVDWLRSALSAVIAWSAEQLKGKSSHGNCCSCTACKNYHDECKCSSISALLTLAKDISEV